MSVRHPNVNEIGDWTSLGLREVEAEDTNQGVVSCVERAASLFLAQEESAH